MKEKKIPVVFCTDDNYVAYLAVTITSLKCSRGKKNGNIGACHQKVNINNLKKLYK